MKKIYFALAALVLAFTGCSQEEDAIQVSEKKAIKVVVNMDKPGFGEDTRAARTGWEEGDEVYVMLDDDLEHLIALTYDGTVWEEMVMYLDVNQYRPMTGSAQNEYLASLPSSGDLKAIYCSSGISGAKPYPEEYVDVEDLEGVEIISIARNYGYYEDIDFIPTPYGECIMTCEDGTYMKDGDLTLTITMIPQVAQFTIRNLSDDGDDEEGKTSQDLEVGVAGGNLVAYAGGTITTEGIMLNQVNVVGKYNACWVHPNTDGINPVGISIYASVDTETNEFADYEAYTFYVGDDYIRNFNCNEYKSRIYNRAAIIMDGPYTDGAASKWGAE